MKYIIDELRKSNYNSANNINGIKQEIEKTIRWYNNFSKQSMKSELAKLKKQLVKNGNDLSKYRESSLSSIQHTIMRYESEFYMYEMATMLDDFLSKHNYDVHLLRNTYLPLLSGMNTVIKNAIPNITKNARSVSSTDYIMRNQMMKEFFEYLDAIEQQHGKLETIIGLSVPPNAKSMEQFKGTIYCTNGTVNLQGGGMDSNIVITEIFPNLHQQIPNELLHAVNTQTIDKIKVAITNELGCIFNISLLNPHNIGVTLVSSKLSLKEIRKEGNLTHRSETLEDMDIDYVAHAKLYVSYAMKNVELESIEIGEDRAVMHLLVTDATTLSSYQEMVDDFYTQFTKDYVYEFKDNEDEDTDDVPVEKDADDEMRIATLYANLPNGLMESDVVTLKKDGEGVLTEVTLPIPFLFNKENTTNETLYFNHPHFQEYENVLGIHVNFESFGAEVIATKIQDNFYGVKETQEQIAKRTAYLMNQYVKKYLTIIQEHQDNVKIVRVPNYNIALFYAKNMSMTSFLKLVTAVRSIQYLMVVDVKTLVELSTEKMSSNKHLLPPYVLNNKSYTLTRDKEHKDLVTRITAKPLPNQKTKLTIDFSESGQHKTPHFIVNLSMVVDPIKWERAVLPLVKDEDEKTIRDYRDYLIALQDIVFDILDTASLDGVNKREYFNQAKSTNDYGVGNIPYPIHMRKLSEPNIVAALQALTVIESNFKGEQLSLLRSMYDKLSDYRPQDNKEGTLELVKEKTEIVLQIPYSEQIEELIEHNKDLDLVKASRFILSEFSELAKYTREMVRSDLAPCIISVKNKENKTRIIEVVDYDKYQTEEKYKPFRQKVDAFLAIQNEHDINKLLETSELTREDLFPSDLYTLLPKYLSEKGYAVESVSADKVLVTKHNTTFPFLLAKYSFRLYFVVELKKPRTKDKAELFMTIESFARDLAYIETKERENVVKLYIGVPSESAEERLNTLYELVAEYRGVTTPRPSSSESEEMIAMKGLFPRYFYASEEFSLVVGEENGVKKYTHLQYKETPNLSLVIYQHKDKIYLAYVGKIMIAQIPKWGETIPHVKKLLDANPQNTRKRIGTDMDGMVKKFNQKNLGLTKVSMKGQIDDNGLMVVQTLTDVTNLNQPSCRNLFTHIQYMHDYIEGKADNMLVDIKEDAEDKNTPEKVKEEFMKMAVNHCNVVNNSEYRKQIYSTYQSDVLLALTDIPKEGKRTSVIYELPKNLPLYQFEINQNEYLVAPTLIYNGLENKIHRLEKNASELNPIIILLTNLYIQRNTMLKSILAEGKLRDRRDIERKKRIAHLLSTAVVNNDMVFHPATENSLQELEYGQDKENKYTILLTPRIMILKTENLTTRTFTFTKLYERESINTTLGDFNANAPKFLPKLPQMTPQKTKIIYQAVQLAYDLRKTIKQ